MNQGELCNSVYSPLVSNPKRAKDLTLVLGETLSLLSLALPMVLTGLLLYSRSLVSMMFLGRLGPLPLAGGALAMGFANITGYSVLSGLAMGMEPTCSQAFGAGRAALVGLTLQRTILLLLVFSVPIAGFWSAMRSILLLCGQDKEIAAAAYAYIITSTPDLFLQCFLHPIRIFLRSQSIILPLTYCTCAVALLHLPINYLLVSVLSLGIQGVALAAVWSNLNLLIMLILYMFLSGKDDLSSGLTFTMESFRNWKPLLNLAIPSCISVCLEWWWYEIMTLLCGLLLDPKSTIASMGILIQTTSLIYIFHSSLSFSVSTRVGNELGSNRPDRARRAASVGLFCSSVLGVAALCFAVVVRNVWARMFTSDVGVLSLTAAALPIVGMCELGNSPQTAGCGVLRGSARPRTAANINLGSFYGVGMPVAIGLAFWAGFDFRGLWAGMLAAQTTCVVFMLVVIRRTDWELQAERAQRLTEGTVGVGTVKVVVESYPSDNNEKLEREGNGQDEQDAGIK